MFESLINLGSIFATFAVLYSVTIVNGAERELRQYRVEGIDLANQWPIDNIDPYLQVFDKSGVKIYQSATQDATLRPIFNSVRFNWVQNEVYKFVIQDYDGGWTDDEALGEVTIQANDLVGCHNLRNPSGGRVCITDTTPNTTTTTTTTPTTTLPPMPTCPAEGVHLYPFPGNCFLYIHCIEGSSSIYRCPSGQLFDSIRKQCEDEDLALCA